MMDNATVDGASSADGEATVLYPCDGSLISAVAGLIGVTDKPCE